MYCFSADIYEQFTDMLKVLKLDAECLGGGRIEHHPGVKKIKVYGYSQVCLMSVSNWVNRIQRFHIFRAMEKPIMQKQNDFCLANTQTMT